MLSIGSDFMWRSAVTRGTFLADEDFFDHEELAGAVLLDEHGVAFARGAEFADRLEVVKWISLLGRTVI